MSQEVLVQARHAFQDRLRDFLRLLSVLTERELDLACGRLADMLEHSQSPSVQVRRDVMDRYVELRKIGKRKERTLRRMVFSPGPLCPSYDWSIDSSRSMHFVRCATNFPLFWEGLEFVPGLKEDESLEQWVDTFSD